MGHLTLSEIEREIQNRDIKTSLTEARKAGLLPRSERIAKKTAGPGSDAGYDERVLTYLSLIDELRSQGLALPAIRQKLLELAKRQSVVEEKKEEAKALLQEAIAITGDDGKRAGLLVKALGALEDISVNEQLLFEVELSNFDNLENKLRYLLGKTLPEKLRTWQR